MLQKLLLLISLNGSDINYLKRLTILEEIIKTIEPQYYANTLAMELPTLMKHAQSLSQYKDCVIKYDKKNKYINISYHVNAGYAGDWYNIDHYTHFQFVHLILGYRIQTF